MGKNSIFVRSGFTDYLRFKPVSSGSSIDLSTADHVELSLKDNLGNVSTFSSSGGSPKLFIVDVINGIIELRPASTDFYVIRSPYKGFIKIFETSSRWYSIPSDDELKIYVRQGY